MVQVWLAKDPETGRVLAQDHEWQDGDFPPGPRGRGWPRREVDVDPEEWQRMMEADMTGDDMDEAHLRWWGDD
jgi:hypothetical protein